MSQLRLRGTAGAILGVERPLTDMLIIGRSPEADLCIDHPTVCAQHAVVVRVGQSVIVSALAATGQVLVNEREARRSFLQPGDRVRVGSVELTLMGPGHHSFVEDDDETEEFAVAEAELVKRIDLGRPPAFHPRAAELLFQLTQILSRPLDEKPLIEAVLDLCLAGLRSDNAAMGLVDEQGGVTEVASRSRQTGRLPPPCGRLSRSLCAQLVSARVGLVVRDLWVDERFSAADSLVDASVRAVMGVPMVAAGEVVGVLVVTCYSPHTAFSEADLDLLTLLGAHLGLWLRASRVQRRQAEIIEQLERTQAHLMATTDRLVRAEQMVAAGRVATHAAHEVRNLLQPLSIVRLLAERHPEDEDVMEITALIEQSRDRVLAVIRELQTSTKGEASSLCPEAMSLGDLIDRTWQLLRHDAVFRDVHLVLPDPGPEIRVHGDMGLLQQVLINLLRNAAQATGPGGTVRLRVGVGGQEACLEVEDDGPGVPANLRDRIFEPFFSTKGADGLGLGLDIARQTVRRHGGELRLVDGVGPGAAFRLSLPRG